MKRNLTPQALKLQARMRLKRQALRLLKRTKRAAQTAGVDLSPWEGEFLGSVETRIETYGRAFNDPEKGAAGSAFSLQQTRKLKEIAAKAGARRPVERRLGPRSVED